MDWLPGAVPILGLEAEGLLAVSGGGGDDLIRAVDGGAGDDGAFGDAGDGGLDVPLDGEITGEAPTLRRCSASPASAAGTRTVSPR